MPPPPFTSRAGRRCGTPFLAQRFLCDPAPLEVRPDPRLCRPRHFAAGRIVLDARPHILEPFSADVHLFLGRGREGALASVVALVIPNELTPAYAYQVLEGRLYNRSAAGPRFGYRLELPTDVKPLIPGLTLHLAEIHLTIDGLQHAPPRARPAVLDEGARVPAPRGRCRSGPTTPSRAAERSRAAAG